MRQGRKEENIMTKYEMLKKLEQLQEEKGVKIDGIYQNSNKNEIQGAINCLECPDDLLDKYFTVFFEISEHGTDNRKRWRFQASRF